MEVEVTVHYATNDTNAALKLLVNNANEYTLNCPTTNGWENYTGTASVEVNLNAGSGNILTFSHLTSGINVDYVDVTLLENQSEETQPAQPTTDNIAKGKTATTPGAENDAMAATMQQMETQEQDGHQTLQMMHG